MKTLLGLVFALLFTGAAFASDYPALDRLTTGVSYTDQNWFNCGLRPSKNTVTGALTLQVVSIRGEGSCSSTETYSLQCERFRNRCLRGNEVFQLCENGDFIMGGQRNTRGFYYGNYLDQCRLVEDYVVDVTSFAVAGRRSASSLTGFLLPGERVPLVLTLKNSSSMPLIGLTAALTVSAGAGVELSTTSLTFADIPSGASAVPIEALTALVPEAVRCGTPLTLTMVLKIDGRTVTRRYVFPVGKPVYEPVTVRLPGTPLNLEADGTITFELPMIGDLWPYGASVYQASVAAQWSHPDAMGEISAVRLAPPGMNPVFVTRGEGKISGSQSRTVDVTSAFAGRNGWGNWKLEVTEFEWRGKGQLNSFALTAQPAVFTCRP